MMINPEEIGLTIINDFISETEENNILSQFGTTQKNNKKSKFLRNSIRRYGSSLPYDQEMVSDIIPKYLDDLCEKIVNDGYLKIKPNSVSINEYLIGNSIAPHIDSKTSGEVISILSLLSDAIMEFSNDSDKFSVKLPRRSLIQMRNEIRYEWRHSVPPVKNNRFSIVFRLG